jgi:hypothetical protein
MIEETPVHRSGLLSLSIAASLKDPMKKLTLLLSSFLFLLASAHPIDCNAFGRNHHNYDPRSFAVSEGVVKSFEDTTTQSDLPTGEMRVPY